MSDGNVSDLFENYTREAIKFQLGMGAEYSHSQS